LRKTSNEDQQGIFDVPLSYFSARKLETGFKAWSERMGEMEWTNYLRRVSELLDTGEWVKDIARAELQKLES